MKFDRIIMNPPYNPNAVWSKFVVLAMDTLKEDGRLVAIHPSTWRESTKYDKLAEKLKTGISELHIMDYEAFKENKVAIKTDWYTWSPNYKGEQTVTYSNGETTKLDLNTIEWILRIPSDSIPSRILKKIISDKHNGLIKIDTGFNVPIHDRDGIFKQCGGKGKIGEVTAGTAWHDEIYVLTKEPSIHQSQNKVVSSHIGKPRAKFFKAENQIGVGLGYYWLTDNESLPILLNSKMLYKCALSIIDPENGFKTHGTPLRPIQAWILQSLNFEGLTATNEQELYKHYNLTQEEIEWCENKSNNENLQDWYVWQKNYSDKQVVIYADGHREHLNIRDAEYILRIPSDCISVRILEKVISKKDNGIIFKNTGFNLLKQSPNGKYKQCGGDTGKRGGGTEWTIGKFTMTDEPTEHQALNKVVMAYSRRPRAKYFSGKENIGVVRGNYWLTNNQSIPVLLNSNMFWKLITALTSCPRPDAKAESAARFLPVWILKYLNFEGLTAVNEQELYKHYNLTQEEINWCENKANNENLQD
jgi:hypothetical protein